MSMCEAVSDRMPAVASGRSEWTAEEQAQQQDSGRSRWTIPGFGDDDSAPQPGGRRAPAPRPSNRQTVAEAAIKSVVRSVGSSVGRAIVRGILGSLARGR